MLKGRFFCILFLGLMLFSCSTVSTVSFTVEDQNEYQLKVGSSSRDVNFPIDSSYTYLVKTQGTTPPFDIQIINTAYPDKTVGSVSISLEGETIVFDEPENLIVSSGGMTPTLFGLMKSYDLDVRLMSPEKVLFIRSDLDDVQVFLDDELIGTVSSTENLIQKVTGSMFKFRFEKDDYVIQEYSGTSINKFNYYHLKNLDVTPEVVISSDIMMEIKKTDLLIKTKEENITVSIDSILEGQINVPELIKNIPFSDHYTLKVYSNGKFLKNLDIVVDTEELIEIDLD